MNIVAVALMLAFLLGGLIQPAPASDRPAAPAETSGKIASPRANQMMALLREKAARAGPLQMAANPPLITPGDATSRIPGSRLVPWDSGHFFYAGNMVRTGKPSASPSFAQNQAVSFGGRDRFSSFLSIEFTTDAAQLEVLVKGNGEPSRMRFVVDGALANEQPVVYPKDELPHLTKIDFGGSKKMRHIRILAQAPLFGGVRVGPADKLMPPPDDPGFRVMFVGDSYTQGPAREKAETSFAPIAAQLLGWRDAWISGVGGTGYLHTVNQTQTFRQRFTGDIKPFRPDVLVIAGGGNDRPYTDEQVHAEARAFFDLVQKELPDTIVFVLGPWNPRSIARPGLNAAIRRAAANRPNFYWVRNYEDNWFTGTGSVPAPTGDGNSDWVVGNDRLHPSPAGINYLAERFAEAIRTLIR